MDVFEAFKLYLALKQHFTTSYDFHKYQGKLKVTRATFEKRNDKAFFHKLAKHSDVEGLLVSTFITFGDRWIGDVVHDEQVQEEYFKWKKVQESLLYSFDQDIKALSGTNYLNVKNGQHPALLRKVLSHEVRLETMITLNDILRFMPAWNKLIQDPVIWPDLRFKCRKYKPFLGKRMTPERIQQCANVLKGHE